MSSSSSSIIISVLLKNIIMGDMFPVFPDYVFDSVMVEKNSGCYMLSPLSVFVFLTLSTLVGLERDDTLFFFLKSSFDGRVMFCSIVDSFLFDGKVKNKSSRMRM